MTDGQEENVVDPVTNLGELGSGPFLGHVSDETAAMADAWIATWQDSRTEDPAKLRLSYPGTGTETVR